MQNHDTYMLRCLELAMLGSGNTAPNPMVGSVLVYNDRIIGEGFHQKCGEAHAEVNCISNVKEEDYQLIEKSTLYVSLEPCNHYGKTPPCTNLIIQSKIPKVIIGCKDIFEKVNGSGIEKLSSAGISVVTGILEKEATQLNRRFFVFHQYKRPYIILKWAQSGNKMIGGANGERLKISNPVTDKLVHKWRSEEAAILIGSHTAIIDNPSLTTRNWKGNNPLRILIDSHLKVKEDATFFTDGKPLLIFNSIKNEQKGNVKYIKVEFGSPIKSLNQILSSLYELNILSLIVEGGANTLQHFIHLRLWDEARVITNNNLYIDKGIASPELENAEIVNEYDILTDKICFYKRKYE